MIFDDCILLNFVQLRTKMEKIVCRKKSRIVEVRRTCIDFFKFSFEILAFLLENQKLKYLELQNYRNQEEVLYFI